MTDSLIQLIKLLDQTQVLYQDLLSVIEQERDLVIQSRVEPLSALLVEKQNILAQLASLETKRQICLSQVAGSLRLPLEQLNLSTLAGKAPEPYAEQIRQRRLTLRTLVGTTARANEESRSLMAHCLNLVQGSLKFLQHWMNPSSVYGSTGSINGGNKNGRLLSGAI